MTIIICLLGTDPSIVGSNLLKLVGESGAKKKKKNKKEAGGICWSRICTTITVDMLSHAIFFCFLDNFLYDLSH